MRHDATRPDAARGGATRPDATWRDADQNAHKHTHAHKNTCTSTSAHKHTTKYLLHDDKWHRGRVPRPHGRLRGRMRGRARSHRMRDSLSVCLSPLSFLSLSLYQPASCPARSRQRRRHVRHRRVRRQRAAAACCEARRAVAAHGGCPVASSTPQAMTPQPLVEGLSRTLHSHAEPTSMPTSQISTPQKPKRRCRPSLPPPAWG